MPAMRRTSRPAPATREPPSQVKPTITPRPAPNRARRELAALQAMELYPICPAPSPSTSPSPSLVQKTSVLYSTDNERVSFAPSSMMPSAASPPPPPPARAAPCAELHSATLPPLRSATAHHQTAERLAYVLSLRLKELVNQKLSRRRAEYAIAHTMDAYPLPDLLQGEGVASTPPPPTEVESIEEAELPPIPPLNLVNAGAFSSELTPTAAATSSRPVEESNLEDGIRGAFFGPDFLRPDEGPSPLSWNPENRNKLERLLGKINRHEASVAQSHTEAGNRADLIRIIKLRPQPNHNRGLFAGMVDRYTTRSGLWITGRKADDGERIRPIAWRLLQQKQDDEGTPAAYRVVPAAPPLSSAAVSAHPDPSTATHTTVPSTTTSEPPQGDVCRGIHFDERALALVVPPTASQQQPRHPESRKLVRHRPRHPYHHGDDFAPQAPHQVLKSTADGDGLNFEWEVGNPDDAYQPPLRKSYAFIDSLGSSFSSIMEELCRGMGKSLEKMRAVLTPEERALARKRLWAKRKMDSRVIIKNAKQKSYAKFQSNQSIPIPKELQAFLPLGATYVPGVGFRDVDGRTIVIPKHLMGIYKKYCAAQDAAFEKAAKRKDVETARESERRKAGRLNVPHGGRYEPGVGFFDAQGKKIERVADLLTTIPPALRGILPEGARYLPGVGFVDALGHPIVVKPEHQELLQHYADQYSATFGEAALTPQDLDHTVTEEEVRAFYLATLDRGSAEGLDGDWARAQDGAGADSFADLSAATIDQRHALSTTVLYDDNGVRMDGTIDAAKMAEARHRRRQGDTRSVLTELEGLDDSFNGGFTDFFFTDDSILNHGDSAYRRISGSEGNMISVWKDEVVEGFRISNELLNLKFRAEAKEEYGALVQERDALRKELASQLTTLKDFKLDIVRLSGVVEGVDKDQYAIELTSDASHYAEEHELKIVLQAEEVDQVAHGFLDQFSKGKTAQRDEACQVSEEDLGFSDEDARRVEAQMEELLMHERGLMHAIKLATIGVANIMNFHASLELESTCKECFFIFEQPRTLWPCGHTFCQRCLTGLYNKNDELICGECGSLCEVGYTPNLSMELVSNYQVGQDTNRETGGPHGHTIEALLRSLVKDLLATQKNYHV